ncbi:kinase-like domain-containing protein [Dichotomocladium elegans]|nr:kinase-like domain-containing protein [Dichotomocladium elegans]
MGFFARHVDHVKTDSTCTAVTLPHRDHASSRSSPATHSSNSTVVRSPSRPSYPLHQQRQQQRFELRPDGTHTHTIKYTQSSKFSASLQHLAGGLFPSKKNIKFSLIGERKTMEALQKERAAVNTELGRDNAEPVFLCDKWGTCQEVIGKGAFGVVRTVQKREPSSGSGTCCVKGEELLAVKEFRRKSSESTEQYAKRLTSEFCISAVLHHPNVIETLDMLPLSETSAVYCLVMAYCDAGDLFNLICEGLQPAEANCFFKQLVRGVQYMHSVGIAHRDLKPENLLLTSTGCLKISDFGSADCFQPSADAPFSYSKGICGSEPYIAPEMFTAPQYDPRLCDVWSCAVIYMSMRTSNQLWHVAKKGEDDYYDRYLKFRRLIEEEHENARQERLKMARTPTSAKRVMYRMLDPTPQKRLTLSQLEQNEWFKGIVCCQALAS